MLEEMQAVAFQIISQVGQAKSFYVEAMYLSREGKFDEALSKIDEGDETFNTAHSAHFGLVQREAGGEELPFSLLLIHAEDQMLTTETLKILALEIIELRKESMKCKN